MNPDIRRLACLGMGAVGDVEAIRDLKPLIQDQLMEVQLAAGMALGAVGTEEALETMLIAFTEGSEQDKWQKPLPLCPMMATRSFTKRLKIRI
jgi:HEAT repeat protein